MNQQHDMPHVVVLAPHDLWSAAELSNLLTKFGISTFHAARDIRPGQVWTDRIRDEIKHADGAIVFNKESRERDWIDLELALLRDRMAQDPAFFVIPVVKESAELSRLPKELRSFQALSIPNGEFTQDVAERLAESIILAWSSTVPTIEYSDSLEQLMAEAEVVLTRLEFIQNSRSRSRLRRYENIVFIMATGVGVFLCLVAFVSRAAWFEYLVASGATLAMSGSIIALLTAAKLRRHEQIEARAFMLRNKLENLLDRGSRIHSDAGLQVKSV